MSAGPLTSPGGASSSSPAAPGATTPPRRLVIANRGEIARRILRAARARGYVVGVISTIDDKDAPVRLEADAVLEVPSFLDAQAVVRAAAAFGAFALHPGYGFLSENADFAAAVERAGIRFVGPTPDNMRALGAKEPAKHLARSAGVPTLEAFFSEDLARVPVKEWAAELARRGISSPYLVKASGGGGGRGMRVVDRVEDLPAQIERASAEAKAAFADPTVFVERFLPRPRHVEIQVFGDGAGGGVAFGERECSLQRRHQKVIEECPSAVVSSALRQRMGRAALSLVSLTRYRGAGTVEFLVDDSKSDLDEGAFVFLELNARLQVEHPVTELAYGVDLVDAQLALAEGDWPRRFPNAAELSVLEPSHGFAIEARLLAEDPREGFLPTPGPLALYREAAQKEGVRVDSGVVEGQTVTTAFDSMIAKIIGYGATREEATLRLAGALEQTVVVGCTTNLAFLRAILAHPDFHAARFYTRWIEAHLDALNASLLPGPLLALLESPAFIRALDDVLAGDVRPASALGQTAAALRASLAGRAEGALSGGDGGTLDVGRVVGRPGAFCVSGGRLDEALAACEPASVRLNALAPLVLQARFRAGGAQSGSAVATVKSSLGPADRCSLEIFARRKNPGQVLVSVCGEVLCLALPRAPGLAPDAGQGAGADVRAPLAGKVLEVKVAAGDGVTQGQVLFVIESMKMQLEVRAKGAGVVEEVLVAPGQLLGGPEVLARLRPPEKA